MMQQVLQQNEASHLYKQGDTKWPKAQCWQVDHQREEPFILKAFRWRLFNRNDSKHDEDS